MLQNKKEKPSHEPKQQQPLRHATAQLRLWPGVVIVLLQWLIRFGVIFILPEALGLAALGGLFGGLAILLWWAFFSRANRIERWSAVLLIIITLIVTWNLLHESMRLMPFVAYIIPVFSLVFVAGAVISQRLSDRQRRVALVLVILLASGVWTLFRTRGVSGDFKSDFVWRWAQTHEERFLAQSVDEHSRLQPDVQETDATALWPGFRGPKRNSVIHGTQIETDWSSSPPIELWRRMVGPGWSSFSVHGNLFYTQEQHGENEVVSCYDVSTGKPVWKHSDATRFWESNGGAGPRGTPTLFDGRTYSLGATGVLNVLNAEDGTVVWSRNVNTDTDTKVPTWGFSGSPVLVDDVVIVSAAGSLIAYDLSTGEPHWFNTTGGDCYSSPHLINIDSVAQILLQNDAGISSVKPADGSLLWEHSWPGHPIVQPVLFADSDILISVDEKQGVRRITVTNGPDGWNAVERWTSARIKPYFNDSVIHNGFVYGFYGRSISCINGEDGERKWKGGRYGRGQLVLLADQDLLLVISEKGNLALVEAIPDQFTELANFPAIKGKTWNHPVLVGDILLVRNAREMAAFRLSLAGS
jgi:outer membrane protein assembly factor BamB